MFAYNYTGTSRERLLQGVTGNQRYVECNLIPEVLLPLTHFVNIHTHFWLFFCVTVYNVPCQRRKGNNISYYVLPSFYLYCGSLRIQYVVCKER